MKRASRVAVVAAFAASNLTDAGCAAPPDAAVPTGDVHALIGGIPAEAASLDAVGALVVIESMPDCERNELTQNVVPVCTATLIGPQTIVTAKHCVLRIAGAQTPDAVTHFFIGPDRQHPRRSVPIIGWREAPTFDGGWAKNGRDVAMMTLAERVTDVTPVRVASPTSALVGKRLAAVGYGARNEQKQGGLRLMGNLTFNTLGGNAYEAMFGGYEAFRSWYLEGEPASAADAVASAAPSEATLQATYAQTRLLADYEAHAGARPGDVQPCFGDSGGPLLDLVDGALVSYGVSSGGVRSLQSICDFGSVYATFGPDTLALIDETSAWKDPCDGLSALGHCEGTIARRCTAPDEGPRRTIVSDCASLGQTCVEVAQTSVRCVDPGALPTQRSSTLPQCTGMN